MFHFHVWNESNRQQNRIEPWQILKIYLKSLIILENHGVHGKFNFHGEWTNSRKMSRPCIYELGSSIFVTLDALYSDYTCPHCCGWCTCLECCCCRCENCVELLFVRGSGVCHDCNTALRRNNFRAQLFEDAYVEKEVDIRRRILKEYVTCVESHREYASRVYNDCMIITFRLVFINQMFSL